MISEQKIDEIVDDNTVCFQRLFIKALLNEEPEKKSMYIDELGRLVDKGADINKEFWVEDEWLSMSPLYYLLSRYYYAGVKYMDNDAELFDEFLDFLFSRDVIPDKNSMRSASLRDFILFEELIKRADDEDIVLSMYTVFGMSFNPLYLEIITGFPTVRLDECIPYEFSYVNKEEEAIYFKKYPYLPIECVLLDYSIERGSAITTDEKRREVIRVLKRQGSPYPDLDKINVMITMMDESGSYKSKEGILKRLKEAYDYFASV